MKKYLSFFMALIIIFTTLLPCAYAAESYTVSEVTALLEGIDSLEQMQNKRDGYTAGSKHYDVTTTNTSIINTHKKAREGYESYLAEMFEKRQVALEAYNSLSEGEKAQLDSELVAKLTDVPESKWLTGEFAVTPRDDEYAYEAVIVGAGFAYEVSNYMVSGGIPQTFILVDTSDGKEAWSPSGAYNSGDCNYVVTYCCDKDTGIEHGTDYKRTNLENSTYFDDEAAKHIRGILQSSYPFVSMEEMKENLKNGGLDADFVDSLNRSDLIAAVQMAVWSFANINDVAADGLSYFATIDVPKNRNKYFNPLHDFTNEIWQWLPGSKQRTYNELDEYRVNTLGAYLCTLEAEEATKEQTVISDIQILKTALSEHGDGSYDLTLLISLDGAVEGESELDITVSSYSVNEAGETVTTSAHSIDSVTGQTTYKTVVNTKENDTVKVEISGVQDVSKGVYLYAPEGGRKASQTLVGVSEGITPVSSSSDFTFTSDIEITPIEPDTPEAEIPESKRNHYIVFGKTEKIGWYSVSTDDGETFIPVFGNSHLEIAEGTEIIIKANDVLGDPFTFYVNGNAVTPDENGYIRITVDGFMLIGALGIPVVAPDVEESLTFFEKIAKFFNDIIEWFKNLFR